MDVWMDGWRDGLMDIWTDEWMNGVWILYESMHGMETDGHIGAV